MKHIKQNFLLAGVLALSCFALDAHSTPDKIGNGGGVWSCEGPSKELYDLMFMDVFEARREFQLSVPETAEQYLHYVQEKKAWILQNLSQGAKINQHIEYVEKNITWIDDIIVSIPDAANRITPHPSLCKQGEWKPIQLVNFTGDFRILVRRELFESPLLTNMERGAVYLHEGIYSYLRSEFGDTTSIRARAIVAFIISNLSDAEKAQRINKVLGQSPAPAPTPEPPVGGYICGIRPSRSSPLYISEQKSEAESRTAALEECIKGERIKFPFPFEIPGAPPGFPGGGDGFGPERECIANRVGCEEIKTPKKSIVCSFKDFAGSRIFTGKGRTRLEAQKDAENNCFVSGESDHTCYRTQDLVCN